MSKKAEQIMIKAIYKVLRPMIRLLMRHGVTYRAFADIARHTYVDVAEEDFALGNRKPSNARTAILTGINRKDIAKLKGRPHPLEFNAPEAPNSTARVITAWLNDRRFQDKSGAAKVLTVDESDDGASFTELVREYTTDITVRALLDELSRIGACKVEGGSVRLKVNAYVPVEDMQETLRIFGTAASDLLRVLDHNIGGLEPEPFLQRTVSYNNIPQELLVSVRQRCRQEGDAFLLQVNEWLAQQDRDENKGLVGSGRHRAGIGIYYIEHPEPESSSEESNE